MSEILGSIPTFTCFDSPLLASNPNLGCFIQKSLFVIIIIRYPRFCHYHDYHLFTIVIPPLLSPLFVTEDAPILPPWHLWKTPGARRRGSEAMGANGSSCSDHVTGADGWGLICFIFRENQEQFDPGRGWKMSFHEK